MVSIVIRKRVSLGLGVVLLAGCGGGTGSGPAGSEQSSTTQIGQSTVTYFGQAKPMNTTSSGDVTVASMAGASFSSLQYYPLPTLANTYITFSRFSNGLNQIFRVPVTGGTEQPLTHQGGGATEPAASSLGSIFFTSQNAKTLESMVSDGSKIATVPTSSTAILNPSVSPTGTQLAYDDTSGNLNLLPAGGGTPTAIQHNNWGDGSSWMPNGSSLVYCAANSSNFSNIYSTATTGGTTTNLVPTADQNTGSYFYPSVSSDGQSITASYEPTGGGEQIVIFSPSNGTFIQVPQKASGIDYHSCFSPDGSEIAFYRSNAQGASPGIYITNYATTSINQIVTDNANDGVVTGLSWSPFPASETLIGGTHFYPAGATGFLLAQNGSQFGSLVAFTTTTPLTASATTSSTNGTQPLVYTLSGDAITKIGYTNYYFSPGAIITPPASTPSALVTIDAGTGQVDMVATAAIPASKAFNKTRGIGGDLSYTGKFTALYDGTGKNIAPNGASQLTIDSKGHLVSFQ